MQKSQAVLYESPVLTFKGNNIADGSKGGKIRVFIQQGIRVAKVGFDGADKLKSHSGAGKILEFTWAVGPVGVNNRNGVGQNSMGSVMVGYNHIHSKHVCMFYFIN